MFLKVPGKALYSNGHKAIHCRAMLITLFDHSKALIHLSPIDTTSNESEVEATTSSK